MARILIPYSRFSGKRQEAGCSQARQDAMAEQAAREEGVEIDHSLRLQDRGVSSFRGAHWHKGALGRFLDLVDAGVVPRGAILCIEQVNRLGRMPWMEQVQLWREILSRGICIRTCEPPARYTAENMNDLAQGCPVVLQMMLGHMSSAQKSQWARDASQRRRAAVAEDGRPHGFTVPDWIERVTVPHPLNTARTVTTGYHLVPERAEDIRQIHRLAQEGWGADRIADHFQATRGPAWTRSGKWTEHAIRHLLTTPAVCGVYQPVQLNTLGVAERTPLPMPDHYPPVLTVEEWQRTQAARTARRRRGGRRGEGCPNLFTHLLRDAFDGSNVRAERTGGGKRSPTGYLYFSTDRGGWTVAVDPVERAILTALADLRASDVDGRAEASAVNDLVADLQEQRGRLALSKATLEQQLDELPPEEWSESIVARVGRLDRAIKEKDEELRIAKEKANGSTRTHALADLRPALAALDRERGKPGEVPLRERIKGRIPLLVESIWVRVQPVTRLARWLHVRIYLHGGETRYLAVPLGKPRVAPLPLRDADFRAGEERGHA